MTQTEAFKRYLDDCDKHAIVPDVAGAFNFAWREAFAKLVAAKEREACAKVCYELPWKDMTQIPSNLAFAAAVRARGEA